MVKIQEHIDKRNERKEATIGVYKNNTKIGKKKKKRGKFRIKR